MNDQPSISIDIERDLDDGAAQAVVARMKAALRNEIPVLELNISESADIHSPGFLAFLQAARMHLGDRSGSLRINCRQTRTRELLEQFGFAGILENEPEKE